MSWETCVVGNFKFKLDTSLKTQDKVVRLLEAELETEIHLTNAVNDFEFKKASFSSHVSMENIEPIFQEFKKYFENFFCDIHYLGDPEERIAYEPAAELEEIKIL